MTRASKVNIKKLAGSRRAMPSSPEIKDYSEVIFECVSWLVIVLSFKKVL